MDLLFPFLVASLCSAILIIAAAMVASHADHGTDTVAMRAKPLAPKAVTHSPKEIGER